MPHPIWKGTMGFGLVSIAVELVPAEAPERLKGSAARRKAAARRSA